MSTKKDARNLNLMRLYYFTVGAKGSIESLNRKVPDWYEADIERTFVSQSIYDFAAQVRDILNAVVDGRAPYRVLKEFLATTARYNLSDEVKHLATAMRMILKEA